MTVRIVGLLNSQQAQMLNSWCTRKYKVWFNLLPHSIGSQHAV